LEIQLKKAIHRELNTYNQLVFKCYKPIILMKSELFKKELVLNMLPKILEMVCRIISSPGRRP